MTEGNHPGDVGGTAHGIRHDEIGQQSPTVVGVRVGAVRRWRLLREEAREVEARVRAEEAHAGHPVRHDRHDGRAVGEVVKVAGPPSVCLLGRQEPCHGDRSVWRKPEQPCLGPGMPVREDHQGFGIARHSGQRPYRRSKCLRVGRLLAELLRAFSRDPSPRSGSRRQAVMPDPVHGLRRLGCEHSRFLPGVFVEVPPGRASNPDARDATTVRCGTPVRFPP